MAKMVINPNKELSKINAEIYGHFSEHLGRCIYEGIYVGEDSPIPNTNGMRNDVVEALKEIKLPVLRWPDMNAISNYDADGGEHFPGWSMEALKYIYEERNAAANGHETLDTDASALAAQAGDLACERYLLEQGKLQVEVMCNLDQVPAAGAIAIAAFLPIEGATGLPVRMWAIAEE